MTEHPLELWLKERREAGENIGKRKLAEEVGCSPSRMTQIIKYGDEPSLKLAARFSLRTGIPIDKFVKQAEAAQ